MSHPRRKPTPAKRRVVPGRRPRIRAAGRRQAETVRTFGAEFVSHRKDRWAGQPFVLEPWQWTKLVLPVYGTVDAAGKRLYDKALYGLARWNGKDELAALLVLHHLFLEPIHDGECYAVAQSKPQAGILFETVRNMINANPMLRAACDVYRREIVVRETGCIFRCLPHDADAAQGFHPSFCVIDELHVHRDREMLDAMLSGSIGREQSLLIVITTAGAERRGVWWEILHEWREDPGAYVYWHGASDKADAGDPRVWRRANLASWVSDEKLAKAYRTLPLGSFERYHLNRPPRAGQNKVFTPDLWRACRGAAKIDPERPAYIAVDASLRRDHTAVVLDQVDTAGLHNVLCWTFTAEDDTSIMSAIDQDEVGALIRELAAEYEIRRVPCDRAYFVRTMRELLDEGLPIEEFPQTNQNMARACQRFYDLVTEKRMRHGGDPALEEHVLNATVKETPFGWRITKPAGGAKVDAAIALAMVSDVAEAERDTRSFAETGGIHSVG